MSYSSKYNLRGRGWVDSIVDYLTVAGAFIGMAIFAIWIMLLASWPLILIFLVAYFIFTRF
jgi:hypothetical protein